MIVSLDGVTVTQDLLHNFPLFNQLVINLANDLTEPFIQHTLILKYIINPVSVVTGTFTLYTVNNNNYDEISTFSIPTLQSGSFKTINLLIDQLQTKFPFANYTVRFTTSKYIPFGSKITVTFPSSVGYDFTGAYCVDISSTLQGKIDIKYNTFYCSFFIRSINTSTCHMQFSVIDCYYITFSTITKPHISHIYYI